MISHGDIHMPFRIISPMHLLPMQKPKMHCHQNMMIYSRIKNDVMDFVLKIVMHWSQTEKPTDRIISQFQLQCSAETNQTLQQQPYRKYIKYSPQKCLYDRCILKQKNALIVIRSLRLRKPNNILVGLSLTEDRIKVDCGRITI